MARHNEFIDKLDKVIGERILEARIQQGLSREELSKKINVTHQQLHKYEKGINRISAGRLAMIASFLNKSIDYFFQNHNVALHKKNNDNLDIQENDVSPNIKKHQRIYLELSRNFTKLKNFNQLKLVNVLINLLIKESA